MKLSQLNALAAASLTGLVALRVEQAFTPYNEGDIAGFPPDEAHKLLKAKVLSVPDDLEIPDAGDDEDDDAGGTSGAETELVEIPDDWKDRHYLSNRALAAKIAGKPINGKDEVNGVIEAELARRAGAAEA